MKNDKLYRKIALERMTSPEQLDQLLQMVSPRLWLGLLAVALLFGAVGVWAFRGSLPTRVQATGVLIRTGGVYDVPSPSAGLVSDVAVRPGDEVIEGQVVARVEQPALLEELRLARARLAEQEERHRELERMQMAEESLLVKLVERDRKVVGQSMAALGEEIEWLEMKLVGQRDLLTAGLIRREEYLATEQALAARRIRLDQHNVELQQLDLRQLSESSQRTRERVQSAHQVEAQRRAVRRLEDDIRQSTQVRSLYSGRILEVMAEVGTLSQQGRPLMRMDRSGAAVQDLEAVVYIPAQSGKQVRPGMRVQVSPVHVKREEHGYMIGEVEAVSEFPATQESMHRTLKNQNLVQVLSGGGAPYEAFVTLQPDPASDDGYAWSARAPGVPIHSGTLCGAIITTERRRPVELLAPFLRRTVGLQ